jgi:HEAT repeat protein
MPLLSANSKDIRADAVRALGQVVTNPDMVTADLVTALTPLLSDDDSDVHTNAASVLDKMVTVNPEIADEVAKILTSLLTHEDEDVRTNVVGALAAIYAQQDDLDTLVVLLTDPLNPLERPVAARALFLITLDNPERLEELRAELTTYAASREPIARMWANKTLAMLELAEWAHIVPKDSEERELIKHKLQEFAPQFSHTSYNSYIFYTSYQYNPSFFGEEFDWAAREALDWLEAEVGEE